MKDDAAPDQAPTVPAIPLRARQRHRARSKKGTSSRWLARQEEPAHEEVPLESATFSTTSVTPPPVGPWEDTTSSFFDVGDSIAPVVAVEEDEPLELPRTPRRGLAAIVIGAVALAGVLCVAAMMKPPAAAPVVASSPPPVEVAPPAEVPPPVEVAPVVPAVPAKELREKARSELTQRKLTDAIASAEEATKVEPEDAEGWLLLGAAQMEAGRAGDARESFRTCAHVAKTGPVGECRSFAR
jgi:hypothetical protein